MKTISISELKTGDWFRIPGETKFHRVSFSWDLPNKRTAKSEPHDRVSIGAKCGCQWELPADVQVEILTNNQ